MMVTFKRNFIHFLVCLILSLPTVIYAENDGNLEVNFSPTVSYTEVEGDRQRFRRHLQHTDPVSGGIEDFTFKKETQGSKLDVNGRLLSERDFGTNVSFWETNSAYFNLKADTFRYYFDSTNLYYAKIPNGNSINQYEIDDKVYADRGVYGFDAGMTFLDDNKVHLGYEHKIREGKTDRFTGGWIRQFPSDNWITWEYPLSQEVNQHSDRIFTGIDSNLMGYSVSSKVEWEKFSGKTEFVESGYYQNGTLVFRRYYKSTPDYTNWNFTEKADRYFLDNKLLLNLGYQYQMANTTSDFDVDAFNPDGTRHRGEHSLNFLDTNHSGKGGTHFFDVLVSAFPVQDYKPWAALKFRTGRVHSDSVRSEEGAEAGVADNNPSTVDERWVFESINEEKSLTESLGLDVTSISKTTLSFSTDFEQKKTRYNWDANIQEIFAGTDDGDWNWKADVKDFRNTYKVSARTKALDWLTISSKYRYKTDTSDVKNKTRYIETKPGDPEFDATIPLNYYYPGRMGDWEKPSHKFDLKFNAKINSRFTLKPYYEYYAERMEVSGEPVKEISNFDSNTFGLGFDYRPQDKLTFIFDISNQLASTHTRSADFSNIVTPPTYLGAFTEDFNSSSLSTSGGMSYQLDNYILNLNGGFVKGKGLFDTKLFNTGFGVNYKLKNDMKLNTAYNFYRYDEEDNGGINDYKAHIITLGAKLTF